jgi:hypothetical protein
MGDRKQAPDITLKSVVSGRTVNPRKTAAPLVLVFATQATTELVNPFRAALRQQFPDPAAVVIASVVDLARVPRLMRKMAESALSKRYEEVVATLEPGQDPSQFVVMLPDWKGELAAAIGLPSLGDEMGVAVVAPGGAIAGAYQGTEPLGPTTELLAAIPAR